MLDKAWGDGRARVNGTDGGNKRVASRQRTRLHSGRLLTPDGRHLADCLIHDASATGARLRLIGPALIPAAFRFCDDVARTARDACVAWRRDDQIGIRFASQPEPLPDTAPAAPEIVYRRYL